MPAKTIYVKESDLPLWDRAQAELGRSLSAIFADCLRRTLDGEMPREKKIVVELLAEIARSRRQAKESGAGKAVIGDFEASRQFAEQALVRLTAGDKHGATNSFIEARSHLFSAKKGAASFDTNLRHFQAILKGSDSPVPRKPARAIVEGLLYVFRSSDNPSQPWYAVSFAPVSDRESDLIQTHQCSGKVMLENFLQTIGVPDSNIGGIFAQLQKSTEAQEIVSLPKSSLDMF